MSEARHYGVLYEINPWMHREVTADPQRSLAQWEELVEQLQDVGASVETMDAVEGSPDMVFTANGGFVWGDRFVASRFRHPERSGEEPHFRRWFRGRGAQIVDLDGRPYFEGAGDALPFGDRVLAGYRIRSEFDAHTALAKALDVEVLSIELTDPRFYHLDLTFCPLDDRSAMVVPDAWDEYGREVVGAVVPEPIALTTDEALAFCANSVVVDETVVMPSCSPRLQDELEGAGFHVRVCAVDEFLKAGGGVRCLTMALDVGPS
ncbi:MAG: dimethylarginine dimethylaminohydrolase family protein [Actinomycetota bacterium]